MQKSFLLNPFNGEMIKRRRSYIRNAGTPLGIKKGWATRKKKYGSSGTSPTTKSMHNLGLTALSAMRSRNIKKEALENVGRKPLTRHWTRALYGSPITKKKAKRGNPSSYRQNQWYRHVDPKSNISTHSPAAKKRWDRDSRKITWYSLIRDRGIPGAAAAYKSIPEGGRKFVSPKRLKKTASKASVAKGSTKKRASSKPARKARKNPISKETGMARRRKRGRKARRSTAARRSPRRRKNAIVRRKRRRKAAAPKRRRRRSRRNPPILRSNPTKRRRRRKAKSAPKRRRRRSRRNPPILRSNPKRRRRRKSAAKSAPRRRRRRRNPPILRSNPGRKRRSRKASRRSSRRRSSRRRRNPFSMPSAGGILANLKAAIPSLDDMKDALALAGGNLWTRGFKSAMFSLPGVGGMLQSILSPIPAGPSLAATVIGGALAGSVLGGRIGKMVVLGGLSGIASDVISKFMQPQLLKLGTSGGTFGQIGMAFSGGLVTPALADYVTTGPQGKLLSDYVTMSDYAQEPASDFARESPIYGGEEMADYYGVTSF